MVQFRSRAGAPTSKGLTAAIHARSALRAPDTNRRRRRRPDRPPCRRGGRTRTSHQAVLARASTAWGTAGQSAQPPCWARRPPHLPRRRRRRASQLRWERGRTLSVPAAQRWARWSGEAGPWSPWRRELPALAPLSSSSSYLSGGPQRRRAGKPERGTPPTHRTTAYMYRTGS
eukprot:SAG31_NODE_1031_length_10234_cov_6.100049_7_plen_173_part_00